MGSNTSSASGNPPGILATCNPNAQATPAAARIRRLTKQEMQNTLTDLFGATSAALASGLEADSRALGFSTGDQRGVSAAYVDALRTMAQGVGAAYRQTVAAPAFTADCFATDAGARACASNTIGDLGKRAFRRPIDAREVTALLAVYDAGRDTGPDGDVTGRMAAGMDYVVRAIVQSPHFIFRTELGPADVTSGASSLTPFELASALSYGILASPPDADLLAAADAGQLATPDQIGAQVRRLIAARPDRFKAMVGRFITEWLNIDFDNPVWSKDTSVYPLFQTALKTAFQQETQAYLDDWVDGGSALPALLTSTDGFVSSANAPVYGLTSSSATLQKTPLPADQRAGILTQPSFLGTAAHIDGSSPVYRGIAVMSHFLCNVPPPVPAVVPPLPTIDKSNIKTTRQRYQLHTTAAFCSACHSQFDPMGYTFENYDGIGAWRTQENGVPIDSSGAIVGTKSSDRPIANAIELAQALAASPDVHACFARQVFRFDVGRLETDADSCAIDQYTSAFTDKGLDLRELLVSIATSPAFLTRTAMMGGS